MFLYQAETVWVSMRKEQGSSPSILPMKQIRCTNCAASMEQNQSKCEYCGTSYKVKKPAESHHELDDLRDEAGRQLFYMGKVILKEDYREKQREEMQRRLFPYEPKQMSPNEIIGSGEEMPEVIWSFKEYVFFVSLGIVLLILFYVSI